MPQMRTNTHKLKPKPFVYVRAYSWLMILLALPARAEIIDRIAVSVGSRVITESQLDREVRVTAFENGAKLDLSPEVKRKTGDRMVEQALIRRELESGRYPSPSASDVESELAKFKKSRFPDDGEYGRALLEYGITDQDVRDRFSWEAALEQFFEIRFRPGVQVSEQEIQQYFEKTIKPLAEKAHPGVPASLEDYREEIEKTLSGAVANVQMDTWLQQTRRRTDVVYHEEAFR